MMPTSPRSPLSFRTAGFPQYGWKKLAYQTGPFWYVAQDSKPASRHALFVIQFAVRPSCTSWPHRWHRSEVRARGLDCAPP